MRDGGPLVGAAQDRAAQHRRSDRAAEGKVAMINRLSRKSPTAAASGRVRMNAAQNSSTRFTDVHT